jgi:prepilin-type N-terminal cleavage/methylation domain-containing protein
MLLSRTIAEMEIVRGQKSEARCRKPQPILNQAFTLIELLVVITIIVILMGLLFPAFRGVQDQAKKTQAKNDLTQIVTSVNAYYTEYGKYPLDDTEQGTDTFFGPGQPHSTSQIFNILRSISLTDPDPNDATANKYNPRKIVFIQGVEVKDPAHPRAGFATQDATDENGRTILKGSFVDPWGYEYLVAVDGEYSGLTKVQTTFNYTDLIFSPDGGVNAVRNGVIAASYGRDGTKGSKTPASSKFKDSDDVISWQ